jgi:aspartyl-tRNA(Asn)/glutamyl-tRNA(Gln) amidotransferase subunit C
MAVTVADVKRIAALARLEFSTDEEERLAGELNRILQYMAKLDGLDTDGVVPTYHLAPTSNTFREDEPEKFAHVEELLAQAPEMAEGYYRVPRIIE